MTEEGMLLVWQTHVWFLTLLFSLRIVSLTICDPSETVFALLRKNLQKGRDKLRFTFLYP